MRTPYEAYGIECDAGWEKLYRPLIHLCELYGTQIAQIKEKFGGLRFYTMKVEPRLQHLIDAAESASHHVCETCGAYRVVGHDDEGRAIYEATTGPSEQSKWIKTLCPKCREKRDADFQARKN